MPWKKFTSCEFNIQGGPKVVLQLIYIYIYKHIMLTMTILLGHPIYALSMLDITLFILFIFCFGNKLH